MRSVRQSGVHLAPPELSYSTQPQSIEVEVSRNPASQYLLLDSKDRIQSSTPNAVYIQPWNSFNLQRPQSLMETFATRIGVSEIRFPWFIPNITKNNNVLVVVGHVGGILTSSVIDILPGYYTPAELVTEINNEIGLTAWDNLLTLSYLNGQYKFTPSGGVTFDNGSYVIFSEDPVIIPGESVYYNNPSLCLTLGLTYNQVAAELPYLQSISGNVTETLYTQYVDIISNKYNQYTTNLDGNSFSSGSNRLLCRLYLADEVSIGNNYAELYQPFLIHRQFKNPKMVMWNKDSVIDWLDISVVDQYNRLVPLPLIKEFDPPNTYSYIDGSYPDFQLTLLATEN
jgi:hypothetical protein